MPVKQAIGLGRLPQESLFFQGFWYDKGIIVRRISSALNIREARAIGIIVSVSAEGTILAGKLQKRTEGAFPSSEGTLFGHVVVMTVSGMGKVNAAHAATRLILGSSPSLVMNIGVAGAYPSSQLKIGDIAVAEREIYGDEGVLLKDGFYGTEITDIPLFRKGRRKYFDEFCLNMPLMKKAVRAARRIAHNSSPVTVKKGPFVTVSTCTGTKKRARELEKRFGAICENMEGAAIAHICTMYGIPMIELRGISNIVEDRDKAKWNIMLSAENCQQAVLELLKAI